MPTVAWRGLSPVWALAFGCYSLTWPGPPAVPTLASGCRSLAPLCLPPSLAPMQPCPWCRCDNLACHGPQLSLTPVLVIVPGFGPELPAPFPLPRCPAAPLPRCPAASAQPTHLLVSNAALPSLTDTQQEMQCPQRVPQRPHQSRGARWAKAQDSWEGQGQGLGAKPEGGRRAG